VLPAAPAPSTRSYIADDTKLLIGWAFDAAVSGTALRSGDIVDAGSTFESVLGFAGPTSLSALRRRYRVIRAPFDRGQGYYGVALGALDDTGAVRAIILLNRLFRLPVICREPIGLATDVMTNGAMLLGFKTSAIMDAEIAAQETLAEAVVRGVPLITAGQSQAGGIAQVQIAYLQQRRRAAAVPFGFLTMNATYALPLIRRMGLSGGDVAGINFSKDLDPGVGPKAPFANRVGLQIYIHRDGTSGRVPGDVSYWLALLQPHEHFLESFDGVSLAAALAQAGGPWDDDGCL
jgi:hypothetical protein